MWPFKKKVVVEDPVLGNSEVANAILLIANKIEKVGLWQAGKSSSSGGTCPILAGLNLRLPIDIRAEAMDKIQEYINVPGYYDIATWSDSSDQTTVVSTLKHCAKDVEEGRI